MPSCKFLTATLLLLLVVACGSDSENANDLFSIEINNPKNTYTQEDALTISISNKKGKKIENVSFALDAGESFSEPTISLSQAKMGNRIIKAYITADGKNYEVTKTIKVLASKTPKLYTYKILESYPHDIKAYTQGLEFKNDTLYESTGQRMHSSLRKTNYKTGEVLQKVDLEDQYFGEGITILNDKIYQLTWQAKTGFIYRLNTLEKTGTFVYTNSKEGWGLCNDGSKIYKSDGTEKIWTLNVNNLSEEDFIEIYTNHSIIDKVNELEWVEGKIYANIYQKDAIAIVNPNSGAVEGVINMKGLQDQVTQHTTLDVLNGIAYKGEPNILYVTGKNWDKLFKVEIIEK
ncbi:MAG: glutaminyl-peptide cyclotransferase [Muricauda sp.]|nr:glutaminyl-peptide cyclotransferase [Allomuricauda sp.]MCB0457097.1 glutaminyl-peptide cyclotransferase [Flavobacteriaceae bacterium]